MITARNIHSIASGVRTLALAGTLTIASMLPMAGLASADGGTTQPSTPSASQTSTVAPFDVDPAGGLIGIEAVVVGEPAGVPVQSEPSAQAEVVEVVSEGTTVTLRIDSTDTVYTDNGATRWWPVDVGGTTGWINGEQLMSPEDFAAASATSDGAATDTSSTRVPFDFTSDTDERIAEVEADGEGLSVRAEPDPGADVVATVKDGTIIDLRIDDLDTVYDSAGTRWWPVTVDGVDGWVSGYYLITPGTSGQVAVNPTSSTTETAPQVSGTHTYVAGDWAVVRTPDSGRTNLYSSASTGASTTGDIPHMALVEVLAPADGGWYEVRWDTVQGFIPGDLLTAGTAPRRASDAVEPNPTPTPAAVSTETADPVPTEPMASGDTAVITSESEAGVNVRESANSDAARVGFLDDKTNVTIVSGPTDDDEGNGWYEISGGDLEGWVRADLLTQATSTSTETTSTSSTDNASDAGFILPVSEFRFTQDYGCSNLGFYSYDPNWGCSVHDGVDMAAPQGTPLLAASDGKVVVAGWCDCGLGFYVEIDHGDGVHSIYGHMASQPSVSVGDEVSRGDTIGQVGSTGLSTGPHVHFMIREDGVTVDPKNYLPPIESTSTTAGN